MSNRRYCIDQEQRVSGYYFLVFLSVGSVLPYFALWLKSIGMSDQQTGYIVAAPSFLMVITTVFIGQLADKAKDWRSAILYCNWAVFVLVAGLWFFESFTAVLILWTLSGLIMMAMFPILDAAAIRFARHNNIEYHKMRAYGSVGFIVGVLLAGYLIDRAGIAAFITMLVLLALLRACLSHALPHFRAGFSNTGKDDSTRDRQRQLSADGTDKSAAVIANAAAQSYAYRKPWFILVLLASALIHASHAYYYTFSAILWTETGYSTSAVSILWALGVVVEIALMWKFSVVARQATARLLLIVAAGVAMLRWWVFSLDPGLTVLVAAQMLHGVTFALMFLATVNFIANWTPVEIAARAQSISATLNTFFMACATLASGYLHEATALWGYRVMVLPCAVAVLCIALSFRMAPRRKTAAESSS